VQVLASAPIGSSGRAINISLPEPQTMRVLP
jgi:hypothetical protein